MTAPALALATASDALAPVRATLRAMAAEHGSGRPDRPSTKALAGRASTKALAGRASVSGISPTLGVDDRPGWVPASALVSGEALFDLLRAAEQRWNAAPHAAAALAWKSYSYWLALPAVLGYAVARRVPLLRPEAVMVHFSGTQPFLMIGLTSVEVAVLPHDPLAMADPRARAEAGVRIVADEDALLGAMRESLVDDHLTPIMENLRGGLHLGRRTLWGSLASGIAHGLSRAADVVPGPTLDTAREVLGALGVANLVELDTRADGGLAIQRRTCCLAFTLPEPTICTGCCIR